MKTRRVKGFRTARYEISFSKRYSFEAFLSPATGRILSISACRRNKTSLNLVI